MTARPLSLIPSLSLMPSLSLIPSLAGPRSYARLSLAGLALAGTLTACGEGDGDDTASADASPTALSCPFAPTEGDVPEGATTDLAVKPVVAPGKGAPPKELTYADIVVGDGEEAKTGDAVEVKYVGAFYETGKEFDSSWSRGPEETLPFGVCREGVVPGFSVGPTGMKVGGRRQIVLPPEYGYGAAGQPPTIPANSTLVFVVDLVSVGDDEEEASEQESEQPAG